MQKINKKKIYKNSFKNIYKKMVRIIKLTLISPTIIIKKNDKKPYILINSIIIIAFLFLSFTLSPN